jgi:hypothetical protein
VRRVGRRAVARRVAEPTRNAAGYRHGDRGGTRAWSLYAKSNPLNALTLPYSHTRANVVAGVTNAHPAHDLLLEFNRVLNRHTFPSAAVATSFPGKGVREVTGRRRGVARQAAG